MNSDIFAEMERADNGSGIFRKKNRLIVIAVVLLVVVMGGAAALSVLSIAHKRELVRADIFKREELLAAGRVQLISSWLKQLARQGDRLVNSELFRLYASEVDMLGSGSAMLLTMEPEGMSDGDEDADVAMLAAQTPMMQRLLVEFVSYSGFISGRVLNRLGETYIATDANTVSLSEAQEASAERVFKNGEPVWSNCRKSPGGLVMDVFLPIFRTAAGDDAEEAVAVLMLTRAVSGKITEFLAVPPLAGDEYVIRLLQKSGNRTGEVIPWKTGGVQPVGDGLEGDILGYSERTDKTGGGTWYSYAVKIPKLDWFILVEVEKQRAEAGITAYKKNIIAIAVLVSVALLLLLGGLWWWLTGKESRQVADIFRRLALEVQEKKNFLNSINSAIPEFVCLKDENGVYTYVNAAFAEAAGRAVEEMAGMDDRAIFGYDTAKRLADSDAPVLEEGSCITVNETVFLRSRKYHFQIVKMAFAHASNSRMVLCVYRDNTELVEAQEKSRRTGRQTINALVRTIEEIDPYLGGHTRLMGELSSEIARRMHMDDMQIETVSSAANLSQIGKVFVDKALINKPGKLTPEELHAVQQHVEHAHNLLKDINFDLPVVDAIYQMNENPDGTGYPRGLKGDAIIAEARVLSVSNSFCAMIRPRSYRPALKVEDALGVLEKRPGVFPPEVVAVLEEILETPAGEKFLLKVSGERDG